MRSYALFLVMLFDVVLSQAEFNVLSVIHHDARTFTQGLEFHNGLLYESAGMYGHSSLQIIHPDTGALIKRKMLDKKYFGMNIFGIYIPCFIMFALGEGITIVNDLIYMLTWREKTMLIYDANSLEVCLFTHLIMFDSDFNTADQNHQLQHPQW
jgi:glutamine cyclotransferase